MLIFCWFREKNITAASEISTDSWVIKTRFNKEISSEKHVSYCQVRWTEMPEENDKWLGFPDVSNNWKSQLSFMPTVKTIWIDNTNAQPDP